MLSNCYHPPLPGCEPHHDQRHVQLRARLLPLPELLTGERHRVRGGEAVVHLLILQSRKQFIQFEFSPATSHLTLVSDIRLNERIFLLEEPMSGFSSLSSHHDRASLTCFWRRTYFLRSSNLHLHLQDSVSVWPVRVDDVESAVCNLLGFLEKFHLVKHFWTRGDWATFQDAFDRSPPAVTWDRQQ